MCDHRSIADIYDFIDATEMVSFLFLSVKFTIPSSMIVSNIRNLLNIVYYIHYLDEYDDDKQSGISFIDRENVECDSHHNWWMECSNDPRKNHDVVDD